MCRELIPENYSNQQANLATTDAPEMNSGSGNIKLTNANLGMAVSMSGQLPKFR
jgi:hypothetical protein